MVKDHSDMRKETRCRHIGYSYRLTARVLLYAPSHRHHNTYHGLCYTSREALAGTRNSSMGPPHEGSIRRPTAPWANALTTELHPAWLLWRRNRKHKHRNEIPAKRTDADDKNITNKCCVSDDTSRFGDRDDTGRGWPIARAHQNMKSVWCRNKTDIDLFFYLSPLLIALVAWRK